MSALSPFAARHFPTAALRWFPQPLPPDGPAPLATLFAAHGRPDLREGPQRILCVWAPERWKLSVAPRIRPWEGLDPAPVELLRVGEADLGGGLPRAWLCWDPIRAVLCRSPRPGGFEDCIYGHAATFDGLVADLEAALSLRDPP